MRRTVSLIILTSILLHGASRLGVLSHLYENRHRIAYAVGLIAEIPIALCSGDYDFSPGLKIQAQSDEHSAPPIFQAREIVFFLDMPFVSVDYQTFLLSKMDYRPYQEIAYHTPPADLFHPPRI